MTATVYVAIFLAASAISQAAVVKRQAGLNCPIDWDPSPCVCLDMPHTNKPSVFCNNVTSSEKIQSMFARLKINVAFDTFFIQKSSFTSLTGDTFGKSSFQMFFITSTNLSSVTDDAFIGSENTAESFLLHNNNFESFNFKSLQPLLKLKNFELSGDKLRAIPDEAFGRKDLEIVGFNGNKITSLGKNIFDQLPKLRTINLAKNNLAELKDSALSTNAAENPVSVLLADNKISKIDKNAFKGLNVQLMELGNNKLEKLDEEIFKPIVDSIVKNQGTLSTKGNPLKCNKASVGWIVDLPAEQKSHVIGYTCPDGKTMEQLQSDQLQ